MNELALVDGQYHWHGQPLNYVLEEFLEQDAAKDAWPFLRQIKKCGLKITHKHYDFEGLDEEHIIDMYCSDVSGIFYINYYIKFTRGEYFAVTFGESNIDETHDIRESVVFPYLRQLAADKKKQDKMAKKNAALKKHVRELEEKVAALNADIAERRLRPGGEEYEEAFARFTAQDYP